jgi:hypothetical protein
VRSTRRVILTKDDVPRVISGVQELRSKEVLVGFPESTTDRSDEPSGMSNAALGYVHEMGSPAANIPARPFLIPGVEHSTDKQLSEFKSAAQAALSGEGAKADRHMMAAGLAAESAAKEEITRGIPPPLKPASVMARRRARGASSWRENELDYQEMVVNGVSPAEAQGLAGIVPLLNTGQLRAAITSILRKVRKK